MKLAVYTTVHPGVLPYAKDWYASLEAQTDTDAELWIGIDQLSTEEACKALGIRARTAHWVPADAGDSPAKVRERAWQKMIPQTDAIIMLDADDIVAPERVEHARSHIASSEVSACRLQLVNESGKDLQGTMLPAEALPVDSVLPDHNVFGLGNSVYRTAMLARCLPVPSATHLVDWYLATQAWLMGARMTVDPVALVRYRQHENNTLPLLPPFTVEAVQRATRAVQKHFRIVTNSYPSGALPKRVAHLEQAARRIDTFATVMLQHSERCSAYVAALNALAPEPLWWSCVAHPQLDTFWTTQPPAA